MSDHFLTDKEQAEYKAELATWRENETYQKRVEQVGETVAKAEKLERVEAQVAALTQARDRLQQENETLKQELQAAHWDSDAATFRAEEYYRQLQALDAAASHLPNLRETLGRYLDGATLLRQREPRLILQDLFALIHDYDKAHPESEHVKGEAAASWQDIATAPKDQPILLWEEAAQCATVGISDDFYTAPWHALVHGDLAPWSDQDPGPIFTATHWMPLPAPPAASRHEEEP